MQSSLKSILFAGEPREYDHRDRLVEAMAECLLDEGYNNLTIADVVRHARVSKRTFYEHFADKEDCYLATYSAVSGGILHSIMQATLQAEDADQRLRAAVGRYIQVLQEHLPISRSFLTELPGVSEKARTARREVHGRFAQLVRMLINQERTEIPQMREVTPAVAIAIVGAIHELVLDTFENGGEDLSHVPPVAFEMLRWVLVAPSEEEGQAILAGRS